MPRSSLFILLVLLITAMTLGRIIFHDFSNWDDALTITENPRIASPSLTNVAYYWRNAEAGLYIPVTYTVWSALSAIAPAQRSGQSVPSPMAFHAASLIAHLLSVTVVYLLLRRLAKNDAAAALGALIFAVHPLQVETVAWTSGLKDLLAGLFALISIWQYVEAIQARINGDVKSFRRKWLICAIALLLGMLSKPSAVVAPLIAGTIDVFLLRRPLKQVVMSVAPLLLLTIPIIIAARSVQLADVTAAPNWTRPLVALDALAFYLYKLVWPAKLGIIYGRVPEAILLNGQIYWTWIAPAALTAALSIVAIRTRTYWPLCAWLVFAIAPLPVLGLTPFMFQVHSTTADHYQYVALLGVAIAIAFMLSKAPRGAMIVVALISIMLATRSLLQARTWKNGITLGEHAVYINPYSATAHSNLGVALAAAGDITASVPHLETAVRMVPANPDSQSALAQAYFAISRYNDAIQHAQIAIDLLESKGGDATRPYMIAGLSLGSIGKYREARPFIVKALRTDPGNPMLNNALATLDRLLASPASTTTTR